MPDLDPTWILAAAGTVVLLALAWLAWRRRVRARALGFDEDVEPVVPEHEISPVVTRMLGEPAPARARLSIPPRADAAGRLPGPGVLQVAGVRLPPGRPTRPVDDAPQAWISSEPIDDAAETWKRLAAGFGRTGLWPILVPESSGASDTRWLDDPARRHGAEERGDAQLIRARLAESLAGSPLRSTAGIAATAAMRGELASGSGRSTAALDATLAQLPEARLLLVAVRRPADALHAIAWVGADHAAIPSAELAQVVESWERRWGTLLVALDEHALTLAVLRPPGTPEEALEALAEQHALCPDEADDWLDPDAAAAALLVAPAWHLGWR